MEMSVSKNFCIYLAFHSHLFLANANVNDILLLRNPQQPFANAKVRAQRNGKKQFSWLPVQRQKCALHRWMQVWNNQQILQKQGKHADEVRCFNASFLEFGKSIVIQFMCFTASSGLEWAVLICSWKAKSFTKSWGIRVSSRFRNCRRAHGRTAAHQRKQRCEGTLSFQYAL